MLSEKLARLGKKRLLLAIHDASFPADPGENIGRGSPYTRASARLLPYLKQLGFTGIQLGPQGQTSRDNASPYDAAIFSRDVAAVAWGEVADISRWVIDHHDHAHAWDAAHAVMAAAAVDSAELEEFRRAHHEWLDVDAMYFALAQKYGFAAHRDWPAEDRDRWADHSPLDPRARRELGYRIAAVRDPLFEKKLRVHHATLREDVEVEAAARAYAFGQMVAHDQHRRMRQHAAKLGLVLYGDFQVGYSDLELWAYRSAFLDGYRMGAPPSRTNPAGQPWGFPVLDPDQYEGRAGELLEARIGKALAEYDGMRIDHPHGLVCPWVYRPELPVHLGARLHESPDLPDHPALAVFTYVRPEQIDRTQPRYADGWVKGPFEPWQVDAYASLIGKLARATTQLSCEVLSTMPAPLGAALAKFGLGRWRVAQKANLGDANDVYRMENARREDWVMLGNHDTAPIFALIAGWSPATRETWVRHLAARLRIDGARFTSDGFIATAMLAECLASEAENVSIFFADLWGYTERFNTPGEINATNWSLQLPADFQRLYAARLADHRALDLSLACDLALGTRG